MQDPIKPQDTGFSAMMKVIAENNNVEINDDIIAQAEKKYTKDNTWLKRYLEANEIQYSDDEINALVNTYIKKKSALLPGSWGWDGTSATSTPRSKPKVSIEDGIEPVASVYEKTPEILGDITDETAVKSPAEKVSEIIRKYPALRKVYGASGDNIVVEPDHKFAPFKYGYGGIEFFDKDQPDVTYAPGASYANPGGGGKYGIRYFPREWTDMAGKKHKVTEEDIFLDMLHGMKDDPSYHKLWEDFKIQTLKDRAGDIKAFYLEDKQHGFAKDGYERWVDNYVDGLLRSEMASETNEEYTEERKGNSPEMKRVAGNIKKYLTNTNNFKRSDEWMNEIGVFGGKKSVLESPSKIAAEQAKAFKEKQPQEEAEQAEGRKWESIITTATERARARIEEKTGRAMPTEPYRSPYEDYKPTIQEMTDDMLAYMASSILTGSLVGMAGRTNPWSHISYLAAEEFMRIHKPTTAEKIVGGLGSLLVDSPTFMVGGVLNELFGRMAVETMKRGLGRGGVKLASDFLLKKGTRSTIKLITNSAASLGFYDGMRDMLSQMSNPDISLDEINFLQTAKATGKGSILGASVALTGMGTLMAKHLVKTKYLYPMASTTQKTMGGVLSKGATAGGFMAENLIFTFGSSLLDGHRKVTWEDFVVSVGTLGGLRASHMLRKGGNPEDDIHFTVTFSPTELKLLGVEKQDDIVSKFRDKDQYNAVIKDKSIPIMTKAKLAYGLWSNYTPEENLPWAERVEVTEDNKVKTYDKDDQLLYENHHMTPEEASVESQTQIALIKERKLAVRRAEVAREDQSNLIRMFVMKGGDISLLNSAIDKSLQPWTRSVEEIKAVDKFDKEVNDYHEGLEKNKKEAQRDKEILKAQEEQNQPKEVQVAISDATTQVVDAVKKREFISFDLEQFDSTVKDRIDELLIQKNSTKSKAKLAKIDKELEALRETPDVAWKKTKLDGLDKAISEIDARIKGLQGMKESPVRNHTTEQINTKLTELKNLKFDLEGERRVIDEMTMTEPSERKSEARVYREKFEKDLKDGFVEAGTREEEVDGFLALIDARSKAWSKETGRDPDEWVGVNFAGVGKGDFAKKNARMYQLADGSSVLGVPVEPEVVNGFYSPVEKAVIELKANKWGSGKQALSEIKKGKGVKQDELTWTGLEEWLSTQGKVSKQDILDYLKDNKIELIEVKKGALSKIEITPDEENELNDIIFEEYNNFGLASLHHAKQYILNNANWVSSLQVRGDRIVELGNKYRKHKMTATDEISKYEQYKLGGKYDNYHEILVILPEKNKRIKARSLTEIEYSRLNELSIKLRRDGNLFYDEMVEYKELRNIQDKWRDEIENDRDKGTRFSDSFRSGHWQSHINVIGHLRISERIDAFGDKVLHIEEIQSDWAQTGKRKGFKDEKLVYNPFDESLPDPWVIVKQPNGLLSVITKSSENNIHPNGVRGHVVMWEDLNQRGETDLRQAAIDYAQKKYVGSTPKAPFITNTSAWTKLLLKYAIKDAVNRGIDKITWTSGESQFARWGSEEIHWKKKPIDPDTHYFIVKNNEHPKPFEIHFRDSKGTGFVERYDNAESARRGLSEYENRWIISANEQTDAEAFAGNEDALRNARIEESDRVITSKEELKGIISRVLSREHKDNEIQKMTDRIWDRMQVEDEGSSLPRKEGMESFYGSADKQTEGIVGKSIKDVVKELTGTNIDLEYATITKASQGYKVDYIIDNGGGIERQQLWFDTRQDAMKFAKKIDGVMVIEDGTEAKQHSITITPELKAAVQKGMPLFQRGPRTNFFPMQEFEVRDVNKAEKLAIEEFGTTEDLNEAGYLTVSGELLDFSGKKDGGPAGERAMDHREVGSVFDDIPLGEYYEDPRFLGSNYPNLGAFMDMGNIRLSPEANAINLHIPPTQEQWTRLRSIISEWGNDVIIEMGAENPITLEYSRGERSTNGIIEDMKYVLKEGRHPREEMESEYYQREAGNGDVFKGAVEFLDDGRAVIHAMKAPDFSTLVHELGHVFERELTAQEREVVKKIGGSEAFARSFERYIRDGEAPTPELVPLFEKYKRWMMDIYKRLKGSPIEKKVNPEVKDIFNRLLGKEKADESAYKSLFEGKEEKAPETQPAQESGVPEVKAATPKKEKTPAPKKPTKVNDPKLLEDLFTKGEAAWKASLKKEEITQDKYDDLVAKKKESIAAKLRSIKERNMNMGVAFDPKRQAEKDFEDFKDLRDAVKDVVDLIGLKAIKSIDDVTTALQAADPSIKEDFELRLAYTVVTGRNVEELKREVRERVFQKYDEFEMRIFGSKTTTFEEIRAKKMSLTNRILGAQVRMSQRFIGKNADKLSDVIANLASKGVQSQKDEIRLATKTIGLFVKNLAKDTEATNRADEFKGTGRERPVYDAHMAFQYLSGQIYKHPESFRRLNEVLNDNLFKEMTFDEFVEQLGKDGKKMTKAAKEQAYQDWRDAVGFDEKTVTDKDGNTTTIPGRKPTEFDDLNDTEKQLVEVARFISDMGHDMNYAFGRMDTRTYAENRGKYYAWMYDIYEFQEGISMRGGNTNSILERMNRLGTQSHLFDRRGGAEAWKVQHILQNPFIPLAKRLFQAEWNKGLMEYSEWVLAKHPDWVLPDGAEPKKGYTMLLGGYGKISNRYVVDHLYEDLTGAAFVGELGNAIHTVTSIYNRNPIRNFQRQLFTVYNPATQLGNFMCNIPLATIIGVSPVRLMYNYFGFARKQIFSNGPTYRLLINKGLMDTSLSRRELVDTFKEMEKMFEKDGLGTRVLNFFPKTYRVNDQIAKLAAFKSLTDMGIDPEVAITRVANGFQNTKRVGTAYDVASGIPLVGPMFARWSGDLARILTHAATRNPITLMATLQSLRGMEYAFSVFSGETEEERKIRLSRSIPRIPLPSWLGGDIPLTWRVGKNEWNVARFFSPYYIYGPEDEISILATWTRFLPITWEEEPKKTYGYTGTFAIWASKMAKDPLFGPMFQTLLTDTDWVGRIISDPKRTEKNPDGVLSKEDRWKNSLTYLFRTMAPYGGLIHDIMLSAKTNEDYYGRSRSVEQVLLRFLGLNLQQFGANEETKALAKQNDKLTQEYDDIITTNNAVNREYEKKEMTEAQYEAKKEEILDKLVLVWNKIADHDSLVRQYIRTKTTIPQDSIEKMYKSNIKTDMKLPAIKDDSLNARFERATKVQLPQDK